MASAVYDSVSIEAQSAGYTFRASHSELKFSGFTAVYEEGRDDEEEAPQSPLPDLREGEPLELKETRKEQHFTQPPARYSEATLIRALEEKGIGRLHLRPHHLHHPQPGVCGEGGPGPPSHTAGRGGHRPDEG